MRRALLVIAVIAALSGCSHHDDAPAQPASEHRGPQLHTVDAGLSLVRGDAEYGDIVGRFGGGVCVVDADGDGSLDLFFPSPAGSQLYLSRGHLRFVGSTIDTGASTSCVAVDLDGDGDDDLVVTGRGGPKLFRNAGGAFTQAPLNHPFSDDTVTTAAVAFDADGDGDLDLAIAAYGRPKPMPTGCHGPCASDILQYDYGSTALLFQQADGTFTDESARLGPRLAEPGLVLLATDLDEDGHLDLFVGNDIASFEDRYFYGDGKGAFREGARALGVATAASKSGVYSMSATDGDVDADGHLDLAESSWDDESDALFRCANGVCTDVAESLGLFVGPRNFRWGQAIADLDDDGLPELLEAVGHYQIESDFGSSVFPTEARPIVWTRASTSAPFAVLDAVPEKTGGRGLLAVDLDGDRDLDVVIGTAHGKPLVLENVLPSGNSIELRLVGKGKNRSAIGARVVANGIPAMTHAGQSFGSSMPARVHFGLGTKTSAEVAIRWPSGATTKQTVAANTTVTVVEP